MYKLTVMADHQDITSDAFDEEEIIANLKEIGVLNISGPNAFEPDNKLTGKTALVWIGKLFRFSFGE